MKRLSILLVIFICSAQFALSQNVDSIKVEQSGDFIKIRYKILNSKPDQIYRVIVQCSMNGGLNMDLRSISGDTGDNVVGGRPEYWVVWDVLKDVEEVKSVEFIVKAELVSDNSLKSGSDKMNNTTGWDKKRFNIFMVAEAPGPKLGVRIGYMGSVGISAKYVKGKTIKGSDIQGMNLTGVILPTLEEPEVSMYSINLTVRIVNTNGVQMHISLGMANSDFRFLRKETQDALTSTFVMHKMNGPELGFVIGLKRVTAFASFTHFDPGKLERSSNGTERCWSNRSFADFGLGLRF